MLHEAPLPSTRQFQLNKGPWILHQQSNVTPDRGCRAPLGFQAAPRVDIQGKAGALRESGEAHTELRRINDGNLHTQAMEILSSAPKTRHQQARTLTGVLRIISSTSSRPNPDILWACQPHCWPVASTCLRHGIPTRGESSPTERACNPSWLGWSKC